MLKPLVTTFSVMGGGLKALKDIKKHYDDLKKKFKTGNKEMSNSFGKIGTAFSNFLSKLKSGSVKVGNAFKIMGARSEDILNKLNNKGNTLRSTFGKLVALLGGGFAIKEAYEGATTLEMNRTAIKSMSGEERANQLMDFGVQFANKTPFETLEVLDSIKKLEVRGLDPTKWITGIGDMSAMLGKSLDQGVEALLDAVTGEFERLKEFGLTSKMLREMFPTRFNNQGTITDLKGFMDDLMKYMAERYKGGMETLSKTTKGMMSTLKGNISTFTSMLISGTATGQVLENSPLGVFNKEILEPMIKNFEKWSKDGTLKKWSENFAKGFKTIYEIIKPVIKFIYKYRKEIGALILGYIQAKIAMWAFIKALQTVISTIAIATNPFTKLFLKIWALGSYISYLALKWKDIKKFWENFLWDTGLFDVIYNTIQFLKAWWKVIKSFISDIWESVTSVPKELAKSFKIGFQNANIILSPFINLIKKLFSGIKVFFSIIGGLIEPIANVISKIFEGIKVFFEVIGTLFEPIFSALKWVKGNMLFLSKGDEDKPENIANNSSNDIYSKPFGKSLVNEKSSKENGEVLKTENNTTKLNRIENHSNIINFTINGVTDPEAVAREIDRQLFRRQIAEGVR